MVYENEKKKQKTLGIWFQWKNIGQAVYGIKVGILMGVFFQVNR